MGKPRVGLLTPGSGRRRHGNRSHRHPLLRRYGRRSTWSRALLHSGRSSGVLLHSGRSSGVLLHSGRSSGVLLRSGCPPGVLLRAGRHPRALVWTVVGSRPILAIRPTLLQRPIPLSRSERRFRGPTTRPKLIWPGSLARHRSVCLVLLRRR